MTNVTDFPTEPERDLIAEMIGPKQGGHSVIVDGRAIPNCVMYDRGDMIEFVLDRRLGFEVPRDAAYIAASFAFAAMAIGAGFSHPAHMHFTQRPFAPECIGLGELPRS